MIPIPLKICRGCLSPFGDDERSDQQQETRRSVEFDENLHRIVKVRESLCSSIESCDACEPCIVDGLYSRWKSYYGSIVEFQQLFLSASDEESTFDTLNLELPWDNAFDLGHETHSDLLSERACVLFTLAALQSRLAMLQPLDTCNGLTKASEHFNITAGIIAQLLLEQQQQHVETNTTEHIDTSCSTLEFIKHLMLAQSQTCSYFGAKNLQPKLIHCLLSTVAMGCAELYQKALQCLQSTTITSLARKMNNGRYWEFYIKAQHSHWLATAEYHKGVDCHELAIKQGNTDTFGVALARIRAAEKHIVHALKHARDCTNDATFRIEGLEDMDSCIFQVRNEMERQHKNPNGIFFETEQPRNLEAITARVVSKANLGSQSNLFGSATSSHNNKNNMQRPPSSICSSLVEQYEERFAKIIRETTALVDEQDVEARTKLAQLNLPQAFIEFKLLASSSECCVLPENIWRKVNKLQRTNEISHLTERLLMLSSIAEFTRERAAELREVLDTDLQLDDEFRKAHFLFSGTKPINVQSAIRREVQQYLTKLENAYQVDTATLEVMETLQNDQKFALLNMSKEEIESVLPANRQDFIFDTSHLEYLLKELSDLIGKRNEMLSDMRMSENEPVKGRMFSLDLEMLEGGLARRKKIHLEIQSNIKEQQPLIQRIISENKRFDLVRHSNPARIQWQNIVQSIEEGLLVVSRTTHQVGDGINFYNSILPIITRLQQQASDVSVTMAVERYDYEETESDRERLRLQDIEDAKVAAQLSRDMEAEDRLRMDAVMATSLSRNSSERDAVMATTLSRHSTANDAVMATTLSRNSTAETMTPAGTCFLLDINTTEVSNPSINFSHPNVENCSDPLREDLVLGGTLRGQMAENSNASLSGFGSYRPSTCSSRLPGVYQVSHYEQRPIQVDDELVAQLVAMDFNPEQAVQALERHDNKIEHALNDLLSENNNSCLEIN